MLGVSGGNRYGSGICWAFVWAEGDAGSVCSVPGEWGEPHEEGGDGHVWVLYNSDILLRAAMVCEERDVKSPRSKDKSLLYYSSPSLTCQTIYCFGHLKMWPVEDDGAGPSWLHSPPCRTSLQLCELG